MISAAEARERTNEINRGREERARADEAAKLRAAQNARKLRTGQRIHQIEKAITWAIAKGDSNAYVTLGETGGLGEDQQAVLDKFKDAGYNISIGAYRWSYVDDDGDLRYRSTLSYLISW